jgi:hypothetical protein
MEKAIQFNTNWRTGSLFFNQDIKANPLKQKADTNKSNGNAHWWRMSKRKDSNVMDVNALTMEARKMLSLQEDGTYGKGLLTRSGGIIRAEEGGPSKSREKTVQRWLWRTKTRRIFEVENRINVGVSFSIY